jgi:hypothetical protein
MASHRFLQHFSWSLNYFALQKAKYRIKDKNNLYIKIIAYTMSYKTTLIFYIDNSRRSSLEA